MKKRRLMRNACGICMAFLFACMLTACTNPFSNKEVTMTISESSLSIAVGETAVLTAEASDKSAITWISFDESIATVLENGTVTGVSEGETKITASCGRKHISCTVTVTEKKASDVPSGQVTVSLAPSEITLGVGDTVKLAASASDNGVITFKSDNTAAVTVSADGVVTAKAVGAAIVTASRAGASASCTVTVKEKGTATDPKPVTVTISPTSLTLKIGESVKLTATTSDGSKVKFESSNVSVASVSSDGVVLGKASGKITVTASSGSAKAVCNVEVKAQPAVIDPSPEVVVPKGYALVWQDEFNGSSLDMSKWGYQVGTQDHYGNSVGPSYWGNDELQYYTEGANIKVEGGALKITAKREQMGDRAFTSSRIVTRDKASWTFGYMEARMKTPALDGMWPAFWMLPQPSDPSSSDNAYGGWAANGEIDIMEAKGRLKNEVDTTIHFGGAWPNNRYLGSSTTLSSNTDEWHTYAVEWTAEYIEWIVDGEQVYKLTNDNYYSTSSSSPSAPFDQPFYILLNLAVGGKYDSYVSPTADFTSADMLVDYVRVFKKV